MQQNQQQDSGIFKFVTGLLLGAAAGAAAGALLTDKPGSELRKDIRANSTEILETLKEKFAALKEKADEKMQELKDFTDENFKISAINIQDQINAIAKQLEELSSKAIEMKDAAKQKLTKNK